MIYVIAFIFGFAVLYGLMWLFIFFWGYVLAKIFSVAYSYLNDMGLVFTFVRYDENIDKKARKKLIEKSHNMENY